MYLIYILKYQYGLKCVYFMLWVITQHYIIYKVLSEHRLENCLLSLLGSWEGLCLKESAIRAGRKKRNTS